MPLALIVGLGTVSTELRPYNYDLLNQAANEVPELFSNDAAVLIVTLSAQSLHGAATRSHCQGWRPCLPVVPSMAAGRGNDSIAITQDKHCPGER